MPRLWAAEKIRRLLGEATDPDEHRGKVVELGLDYGLVTPFTSILALESEQAYAQQGIRRRRSPLRGVKLTALTPAEERRVIESMAPLPPVSAMGCSKSGDGASPRPRPRRRRPSAAARYAAKKEDRRSRAA